MTQALESHRARLAAGEIYNGLWMMSTSQELAKVGSAAGYDYVCLDMQHGFTRPTDVLRLTDAIRASGSALVTARVSANRFTEIGMLADAGVEAVIVPLVSNVAEAEAAVSALDYPSRGGDRSWGPTAELMHNAVQDTRDERPLLFVMIENKEGLANVEKICEVPGIDGVYVGPADLAFAVDALPGQPNDAHAEALVRIRTAADKAGIVPGIHCGDGTEAKVRKEQGFRFITSAGDIGAAGRAFREDLATARG
ncbi:MAG: HpcH/HpaI aldolase family protein [Brevibacterium aurantiacum]|uniref:Aldolase n=2 Tax=Brevibacterium aurantiacum TaxID=273384 RepID=A0A2H1KR97_BREAU|nr:aldolase/citrate lyase family protein [Brevibacterium aurantiacum]MDN5609122.1 aldolase/citrate lyase family protein [Brevibacterium sp.]AZL04378.1 aldolase [Brevibacterium aurantiacum]AZL07974.1 aldolase [Brevibacterium aurantiacum]AZT95768.1 aldolase [Brevibacterium aurantiacum]MDN5712960.1 aldolase/citrate lyase family protein [Brevibacterium aurantiacum]